MAPPQLQSSASGSTGTYTRTRDSGPTDTSRYGNPSRAEYDRARGHLLVIGILGFLLYLLPDAVLEEIGQELKIADIPLTFIGDTRLVLSALVLILFNLYLLRIMRAIAKARKDGQIINIALDPLALMPGDDDEENTDLEYMTNGIGLFRGGLATAFGLSLLSVFVLQIGFLIALFWLSVLASARLLVSAVTWQLPPDPIHLCVLMLLVYSGLNSVQFVLVAWPPQTAAGRARVAKRRLTRLARRLKRLDDWIASDRKVQVSKLDDADSAGRFSVDDITGLRPILEEMYGTVPEELKSFDTSKRRLGLKNLLVAVRATLNEIAARPNAFRHHTSMGQSVDIAMLTNEAGKAMGLLSKPKAVFGDWIYSSLIAFPTCDPVTFGAVQSAISERVRNDDATRAEIHAPANAKGEEREKLIDRQKHWKRVLERAEADLRS